MSNEETIGRFFAAMDSGDIEAATQLVHDDIVMHWPQSGERFRGKDNAVRALGATEVKPEPAGEPRLLGGGDVFVMQMPLRYGDEIWHYCGVFELDNGLIRRTTEYFGAPFPASEARAAYAER